MKPENLQPAQVAEINNTRWNENWLSLKTQKPGVCFLSAGETKFVFNEALCQSDTSTATGRKTVQCVASLFWVDLQQRDTTANNRFAHCKKKLIFNKSISIMSSTDSLKSLGGPHEHYTHVDVFLHNTWERIWKWGLSSETKHKKTHSAAKGQSYFL